MRLKPALDDVVEMWPVGEDGSTVHGYKMTWQLLEIEPRQFTERQSNRPEATYIQQVRIEWMRIPNH